MRNLTWPSFWTSSKWCGLARARERKPNTFWICCKHAAPCILSQLHSCNILQRLEQQVVGSCMPFQLWQVWGVWHSRAFRSSCTCIFHRCPWPWKTHAVPWYGKLNNYAQLSCFARLAHVGTCWHVLAHVGTCWHCLQISPGFVLVSRRPLPSTWSTRDLI